MALSRLLRLTVGLVAGLALAAALGNTAAAQVATDYTYDALGRLVTAVDSNGKTVGYAYDLAGNRTRVSNNVQLAELRPTAFSASNGIAGTGLSAPNGMRDGAFLAPATTHATAATAGSWITADFGSNQHVDHIDIAPNGNSGFGVTAVNGVTVQWSTDNVAWTTVGQVSGAALNSYTSVQLGGVLTRYVRLYQPAASAIAVGDFRFFSTSNGANHNPEADSFAVTIAQAGGLIDLTSRIRDVDLDPLSFTVNDPTIAQKGTPTVASATSINYTPNAGASDNDTFSYRVSDGRGGFAPGLITVTINSAAAPVVTNKNVSVVSGNSVPIDATPTGAWTSLQFVTGPNGSKGTATISGGVITYTANGGFETAQTDTFTYKALGPGGPSNTATVTVTISPPPAPTVANKTPTVVSGNSVTIDVTPTGAWSLIRILTQPSKGSVTKNGAILTYAANSGIGSTTTDTFNYDAVGPGGGSPTVGTITVTITPAPTPPVTSNKFSPVGSGTTISVDLTPGGQWTSLEMVSAPSGALGTAYISGSQAVYTANSGIFTTQYDTFTFRALGPAGYSNTSTVTMTINPQVAPPTAYNRSGTTDSGSTVVIALAPGGNWASAQFGTTTPNPTKGSGYFSLGDFVYTANSGITAQTTDTFTYNVSGQGGTSNTASITVTINPVVSQIVAHASPLTFNRQRILNTWQGATSVGASVSSGGSGSYNWEWRYYDGDNAMVASSPTNASTAWTRPGPVGDQTFTSRWYCRITDTVTGQTADTELVTLTIEYSTNN